ncbi:MAG: phosphoribosylformylglycinamidine synthase subunit PurQ, partial [Rickettsiales bacterium]
QTDFTKNFKSRQVISVPIAHMDGNYFANSETLKMIEDNSMIAFKYVDAYGNVSDEANPNGSSLNIAGIYNKEKNILGMMPHPERAIDKSTGSSDGLILFESLNNLF